MLVRDAGDAWQIVLQTDHGELAGQFARAWAEPLQRARSLHLAAARHDDGWFVWEAAPGLDRDGRPCSYLDVDVKSHIAFYRAAIAAIGEQDAYAGLLVSMHGAGIYQSRYGLQPSLQMSLAGEARQLVDAFVAGEERTHDPLAAELGVSDDERWLGYRLLQAWDQLSLYASLNDLAMPANGDAQPYASIPAVPLDGGERALSLHGLGAGRVAVDPFPFGARPAEFTLLRRLVPKREWPDAEAFRADFAAAAVEPVSFTMEPS